MNIEGSAKSMPFSASNLSFGREIGEKTGQGNSVPSDSINNVPSPHPQYFSYESEKSKMLHKSRLSKEQRDISGCFR